MTQFHRLGFFRYFNGIWSTQFGHYLSESRGHMFRFKGGHAASKHAVCLLLLRSPFNNRMVE